ncbi:MAG: ribonuclease III [Akkermansia sp.]|nr:ribonuclease III [Akkermansia sp.]
MNAPKCPLALVKSAVMCYGCAMQIEVVEQSLQYTFTDSTWLKRALTHPSADQKRSTNLAYERLEYLGDAVLELVVSTELFRLFPKADEGTLTKLRSGIVSRQHLSDVCRELGWCEHLAMSPQLEKTGGRQAFSVLANTFESVIGAVMADSNYLTARKVALHLLDESIKNAYNYLEVNHKGKLLEVLQAVDGTGPEYVVTPIDPEQPAGPFHAKAMWHDMVVGEADGSNKRRAQVGAAQDALTRRVWENK